MGIVFFSSDVKILAEWEGKHRLGALLAYDLNSLEMLLSEDLNTVVVADYDSVSHDINKLLSTNNLPKNIAILEKAPEIQTGKNLILRGVKAYGNSRMSKENFAQMLKAINNNKVWTYPELTAALSASQAQQNLTKDSKELLEHRLSKKELEVVYMILDGLTNDAIASKLNITTRTVKAHISSIFQKLHVNDRLSLVLLLK